MEDFFNYSIFQIGDYAFRISVIVKLILLITLSVVVLFFIKKIIYKTKRIDYSRKFSIYQLIKYLIIVICLVSSFRIVGFDVTVLLASFAALLVGIGLGLQNLFSDYMSGIIILFDSSVKVGDIIEVNGTVCKVIKIGLRTTTVLTRDDRHIILPNTNLTKSELINWTHAEVTSRFEVAVGVSYSSDIHLVMKVLKDVALTQEGVLKLPVPFVRFNDYADSSLLFTLYFWSEEVFRVENIRSYLRIKIFDAFKANGIQIPFPQRVLHLSKEANLNIKD